MKLDFFINASVAKLSLAVKTCPLKLAEFLIIERGMKTETAYYQFRWVISQPTTMLSLLVKPARYYGLLSLNDLKDIIGHLRLHREKARRMGFFLRVQYSNLNLCTSIESCNCKPSMPDIRYFF